MKEKCKICNSDLHLDHDFKTICSKCMELSPINKRNSLELCEKLIRKTEQELYLDCSFFSLEYLIGMGCWLRESDTNKSDGIIITHNLGRVIFGTILIKKALNGWHGDYNTNPQILDKILPYEPLNRISKNIRDFVQLKYNIILIKEDYGTFFEYSDSMKFETKMKYSLDNEEYIFLANMSWLEYRLNLEEFGISSKNRIEELDSKWIIKKRLKEIRNNRMEKEDEFEDLNEKLLYETFERCYNGLNYVYPDPEMFSFKEIPENNEVINFLKELYLIAKKETFNQDKIFFRISKPNFFEIADKYDYNSIELYNTFVSSTSDFKNFPILIEIDEKIILCPGALFLVHGFLNYKFNREIANNVLTGEEFEDYIEEKLLKLGFSTEDPNNSKLSLRGRIVTTINGRREIDLIAYDDSSIWVIECKDQGLWRLDPKILWKKRQDYRIRDIKKEINEKQLDRVQYVKDNYKSYFGFKKDFSIKGLLVTRIKENINEYKGIKIVSGHELSHI